MIGSTGERFIADVMLGRLARWLRALGYDTEYDSTIDDQDLAQRALSENRILLTRDVELTRRRGLVFVLIKDDALATQLKQVVSALHLPLTGAFSRCLDCNGELVDSPRAEVEGKVPPFVLATQTRFRNCPRCGKVYWRGTHWSRMRAALEEIGETI